jgi:hypothetical protein
MQLPVLIEPLPGGNGFRARMGDPFNLAAEAGTAEEAVQRLQAEFQRRLGEGVRVAAISFGPSLATPPAGWLPHDDLTREWLGAIDAYRKECDEADQRRILGGTPDDGVPS